ncbi:MAG: triose-phosphate isomerase [Parcubacteria group bacterium]|nr:triose-phosphate isomerase [Parcubacteria group bacterium]
MNKKIIVANWKMNPQNYVEAEELMLSVIEKAKEQKNTEIILCLPFVWLTDLSHKYKNDISFGAQDIFWEDSGAYTGEISPKMIFSSGVEYVIIGHSERRALGETDEMINKKLKAALRNNLRPILAVGEKEREGDYKDVIMGQFEKALDGISKEDIEKIIFAYEPIWAIGTGLSDKPEDTIEVIKLINEILNSKFYVLNSIILYGGSVDSRNVGDFISKPEIAGVLVGGASVDKEEFKKIIEIASNA